MIHEKQFAKKIVIKDLIRFIKENIKIRNKTFFKI